MKNEQKKQRKYALIADIALMVMTLAALFSYGLVLGGLIVKGDAIATFDNIKSSIVLFLILRLLVGLSS
ncbi:hypothetical protein GCM10020331_004840 [Ectobacillus funiculus]